MKLRGKFALLIVGMVVVPSLVVAAMVLAQSLLRDDSSLQSQYVRFFRSLRPLVVALRDSPSPRTLETLEHALQGKPEGLELALLDESGEALVNTFSGARTPFALADLAGTEEGIRLEMVGMSTAAGRFSVVVAFPRDAVSALSALTTARPPALLPRYNRRFFGILALFVFATITSVLIVRSLTSSIRRLEAATSRIAAGDLDFELQARGTDEIGSLTRSFDAMRRSLREEYERRARFIMGVSHDLKTPLALIEGYAEALADGHAAGDEARQARYLCIIRDKSRNLGAMVEELIDFARMETGEWRLRHRSIPASAFFGTLAKRFAEDALLLGRSFRASIQLPESLTIRMDETLVSRALENLVGNALRYTPAGGSVSLEAGVETATPGQNEIVRVRIRDDGPGIPAGDRERIFDPFFRGSASRRDAGHGLGLFVVKWVVQSHGWTIDVSSAPGSGTVFTVTLPPELCRPQEDR